MNNKVIIGIIVALAIAAGGVYVVTKNRASVDGNVATNGSSKQSLEALLAGGRPLKCTFKDETDASKPSGTTYIANGKMRGDFDATVSGSAKTGTHMILDGKTTYTWMDGSTEGYMMAMMDSQMNANVNVGTKANEAVGLKDEMNYHCDPWTVDASVFVRPANVKFTDYTSLLKGINANVNAGMNVNAGVNINAGANVNMNNSLCSVCDTLTGVARTQCRASYGCK